AEGCGGAEVSLDRAAHGHGEPVLLLLRGQRLRAVLPQVQLLLSVQREAVPERARVREAAARARGDRLRGAGQRLLLVRGPGALARDRRRSRGRTDRGAASEVARPPAPP